MIRKYRIYLKTKPEEDSLIQHDQESFIAASEGVKIILDKDFLSLKGGGMNLCFATSRVIRFELEEEPDVKTNTHIR
jgi:hypothetical protein